MEPRPDERLPGRGLALGDLVLVVREDQVDAAGVDVERRAEVLHRHRRALDVPARPAGPDRPSPTTARPASGPSRARSRGRRPCAYSSASTRSPTRICSGSSRGELAVGRPRGDPEEDRAVVGPVGVALLEERLDERDHLVDVLGRPRQDVRRRHPQGSRVVQEPREPAVGELVDPDSRRRRAPDDLVVDVGDVHDPRDAQAAVAEVADEQVGVEEAPEVADVGRAVDRRPAAVDPDVARLERLERPRLAGQRVVEPDVIRAAPAIATAAAEMPRPAPSIPLRLPVDALTLTAPGGSSSSAAIASRISSRSAGQARARADDRQVDRRRTVARRR